MPAKKTTTKSKKTTTKKKVVKKPTKKKSTTTAKTTTKQPTTTTIKTEPTGPKPPVMSTFFDHLILTESSDAARDLNNQSCYGTIHEGQVQLSLLEALYLIEKKKLVVKEGRKTYAYEQFLIKAKELEPQFWVRYAVYRDLRNRGYIVKTALKFGADFRIYDRGVKPGEDHARWIVYPVHEGHNLTWYEFSAKNRVAHSTKKRLMIGTVDGEGDVTYWEIRWMRP